jgi:hypothetical protein
MVLHMWHLIILLPFLEFNPSICLWTVWLFNFFGPIVIQLSVGLRLIDRTVLRITGSPYPSRKCLWPRTSPTQQMLGLLCSLLHAAVRKFLSLADGRVWLKFLPA